MASLSTAEQALVAAIDPAPMLARVQAWSAINSGTGNLEGLTRQAEALAQAFATLPGEIAFREPAPVRMVAPDGRERDAANGRHLVLSVRRERGR